MLVFAVRRLLSAVPVLFATTFFAFLATTWVVSPLDRFAACVDCDEAAIEQVIALHGLDRPVVLRYVDWLTGALTGDLGTAVSQGHRPVSEVFWDRAGNTVLLAAPALVLTMVLGLAAGVYSALRQYSRLDHVITSVSYLGLAMPTFLVGLLVQVVLTVWVPRYLGIRPFWSQGMRLDSPLQYLRSVTLPALTLTFVLVAADSRYLRAAVLDLKAAEFIRTARAKGLSEHTVITRHLLRHVMVPAVTLWSLNAAALLGGALVTENVFSWPGLGRLLVDAVFQSDLDMLMAIVVAIAGLVVAANVVADVLYGLLDPRIRRG